MASIALAYLSEANISRLLNVSTHMTNEYFIILVNATPEVH